VKGEREIEKHETEGEHAIMMNAPAAFSVVLSGAVEA
jgi:hypothetical protein